LTEGPPDFLPPFLPDAGFELVDGANFILAGFIFAGLGDCTFASRRQTSLRTTAADRPAAFRHFPGRSSAKGVAPFA